MELVEDIPSHTTPSLKDIEDFLMRPDEGESPYADLDLAKYQTDDFQYTRRYMKDGVSKFNDIAKAILINKPNLVKFVIEYVGRDYNIEERKIYHSVFKLSHLMKSFTNEEGGSDDQYAHRMAGNLIEEYARQYCIQNNILTYPNPRPGSADTAGFAGAFGLLIERAKDEGVVKAGQGI